MIFALSGTVFFISPIFCKKNVFKVGWRFLQFDIAYSLPDQYIQCLLFSWTKSCPVGNSDYVLCISHYMSLILTTMSLGDSGVNSPSGFCFVCVAGDEYSRLDYNTVCIFLLFECVCLLFTEATNKASCSSEGPHRPSVVCHCSSRRWVHVLCTDDTVTHSLWTVWRLSALSLVR